MSDAAIGVFDSGVGGLTVMRALMARLPQENLIYFGDTARVPYGVKSAATIGTYAAEITQFLLEKNVKMLIVACNTIAAVASQTVKDLSPVPVLDVLDAGARAAVAQTRSKHVGIIGTLTTINSGAYVSAIQRYDLDIRVVGQACPLFVPLVEEGWLDHPVTRLTADEYLQPLLVQGVDTLVMGCTHYPLLQPLLQEVAGSEIALVDSAQTVAEQAALMLGEANLERRAKTPPHYQYYVTDVPLRFQAIGERFLGRNLTHVSLVRW